MAWVRIDDSYGRNPKILSAGPLCRDLYILALCWCNNQLSDGYIPASILYTLSPGLRAADKVAGRLVELGLWHKVDGGYYIHDYTEYQPTKEQVMAQRRASAARQERSRSRRESRVSHTVSNGVSHTVSNTVSHSAPARPDPIGPSVGSLVTPPEPVSAPDKRTGSRKITKAGKAKAAAEQAEYEHVRRQEWAMLTPQQREARIKLGMVPPPTLA